MLSQRDHKMTLRLYNAAKRFAWSRMFARVCASVLVWPLGLLAVGMALSRGKALPFFGAFVLGWIINQTLEGLRTRHRPFQTHGFAPLIGTRWLRGSFPSDHAMMAGVFAMTLVGSGYGWVAVPLALLIGLGRVSVGVHYVSDVLVGWGIGVGSVFMAGWVLELLF